MSDANHGSNHVDVSVVIPAYNCARFIGEAVQSVLDQPRVALEVIVVDDGSTDETVRALAPWATRVRYVYQSNQGQSATRNHGLRLARGKFVLFLDGDDYLLPDTLPAMVARLEAEPTLDLVQGATRQVDQQGCTLRDEEPWLEAPRLDLETCVRYQPVQLGAMLMRRAWPERIGAFDSSLSRAADVDFLLRLALAGCAMEWLRRPVLCYRQHDRNMTRDAVEQAEGLVTLLGKFFARPDLPPHIKRLERRVRFHSLIWSAWRMSCTGQVDQIAAWLERSLAYSPYSPEEAALEWVRQFVSHDARAGRAAEGVSTWLPGVRRATETAQASQGRSDALLVWWAMVWSHYLDDDPREAAAALVGYRGAAWAEVLSLAQESVLLSPAERRIESSTRFWADAEALGLVVASRSGDAVSLYLTAFGQASLGGEWGLARQALGRALGVGFDRRAAVAWMQFLRKAVAHAAGVLRRSA